MDIYIPFGGEQFDDVEHAAKAVEYLKAAVDSVIAQDTNDWRLTLVDDRLTVSSDIRDYVTALAATHPELDIRYSKNVGPHGQAGARNHGVELATSVDPLPDELDSIVTFLGADDLMQPHFVRVSQAAHAEHPFAAFVQASVDNIGQDGTLDSAPIRGVADAVKDRLTPFGTTQRGEEAAKRLLDGNYLRTSAVSFKKAALRDSTGNIRWSPELEFGSDLIMFLDIVADGHEFAVLPQAPVEAPRPEDQAALRYRRHPASTTARITADGRRFELERQAFGLARGMMLERGWPDAARAAGLHWTSRADALVQFAGAAKSLGKGRKGVMRASAKHAVTRELPMAAQHATRLVTATAMEPQHASWEAAKAPGYRALAAADSARADRESSKTSGRRRGRGGAAG